MARFMGPRFKLARHLGVNVFNHPKALKRGVKQHHKLSEYGEQLLEKQKLKAIYGMLSEKQLVRYFKEAQQKEENTAQLLAEMLECRLDVMVYRLKLAQTIFGAQQLVSHGHVLVNGKKVDIPSFRVRPGTVIEIKENSRGILQIKQGLELASKKGNTPSWLEVNAEQFKGTFTRMPKMDEISVPVDVQVIIELYSK